MVILHKGYKKLAECDVLLQKYEKLKGELAGIDLCKTLNMQLIK